MRRSPLIALVKKLAKQHWVGPHFFYDLIRLARNGWPTIVRVLYLVILLVSLTLMYRTQGNTIRLASLSDYARYAHNYAYTLIVLQDILVLVLLPVYVASSIASEKENGTLEGLTLTHLTDRELVLGKLGARLMHLGAVVLSSFPLLVFMHLWGNVDINLLIYHEVHTFLLLLSAGSLCILISTQAESVFQAISQSYIWLAFMGGLALGVAFVLPWMSGTCLLLVPGPRGANVTPAYLTALPLLILVHVTVAVLLLKQAIAMMEVLRRKERKAPRKVTGALALTDDQAPAAAIVTHEGQVQAKSRIHPWAWPVADNAVHWKECVKDGTSWSLSIRWFIFALIIVPAAALLYHMLSMGSGQGGKAFFQGNAYSWTFTTYLVAMAAYVLVVLFQMTLSVAGEREHGTLTALLLVPEERRAILWAKWLGPWWRNWPILAVSNLGVVFGLACGLYPFTIALLLLLLPWPFLLMTGGIALWLSVMCSRVLFANVALVGFLGMLFLAHVVAGDQTGMIFSFYVAVIGKGPVPIMDNNSWTHAFLLAAGEQTVFLTIGILFLAHSFYKFGKRDYATS